MVICYSSNRKTESHSEIRLATSTHIPLARTYHVTTPQLGSLGNVVHGWTASSQGSCTLWDFWWMPDPLCHADHDLRMLWSKFSQSPCLLGTPHPESLWFNIQASNWKFHSLELCRGWCPKILIVLGEGEGRE